MRPKVLVISPSTSGELLMVTSTAPVTSIAPEAKKELKSSFHSPSFSAFSAVCGSSQYATSSAPTTVNVHRWDAPSERATMPAPMMVKEIPKPKLVRWLPFHPARKIRRPMAVTPTA